MIRSELHFSVVYLDICSIFHGVTHESFQKNVDLESIELTDMIQQDVSIFLVDIFIQKSISYNDFSRECFHIDRATTLRVFGDDLKWWHNIDVDGLIDGIFKIFFCLFLPAWLDWVFEHWEDVLSDVFV